MTTEREALKPVHDLKTWPPYFAALLDGRKTFEIRENDREFQVGDMLRLREWDPASSEYTGREMMRVVSYIMSGGQFGLDQRCVVLALATPPAGPVVWVACRANGDLRAREVDARTGEPFGPVYDLPHPFHVLGAVLAPGECKRVRLVPVEGTDGP